jgi:hypothetical protein
MTLFPQLTDTYYVDNDLNILKYIDYCYSKYITVNQSFWTEAERDNRFFVGDQTLTSEMFGNLPSFRRRQFTFNHIRRIINMISGRQRQHRKSTIVTPIEARGQKTADQFTKLLYHIHSRNGFYETISDAFQGALVTGMNLLSLWIDYHEEPVSGDIKLANNAYNAYLIDPYFRDPGLSDCNSIYTRKYLTRQQVMSLLPGREEEIRGISGWGNKDGKFNFMPESYGFAMQDLIIFDEFWYLASRKQTMLVDPSNGECIEWRGQPEDLAEFMSEYPQVMKLEQEVPTVKLAIVVQGKVMYHGPNPLGIDRYPFVPVWAYYEPQTPYWPWRVQGVVRGLVDAQFLFNKRKIIELDLLESQINSGWKMKEDALVNPKDAFLSGQGRVLTLKRTAQMTDAEQIPAPRIDPSVMQISASLGDEITAISGANEELLGAAEDDKAGILSMLRQGAGLTTLQVLFDNLDRSQKILGDLCIDIIQANWTPGKVQRIIDEEPTQEFYNRAFGKYDSIVEEAPLTSTQRQLALQQSLYLREIGIPIPTEHLLNLVQVPDKDKLTESIMQTEQAQQKQAQQMAMLQMQQLQVDNETKLAYAQSQKSLAAERINKVHLDAAVSAERIKRADEDRTTAILNLVKAAKELKGMDLDQIEKALSLAQAIGAEDETEQPLPVLQAAQSTAQSMNQPSTQ